MEEGKAKRLPKGVYMLAVIVTYDGTKTLFHYHVATVAGDAVISSLGEITLDMDYVPPTLFSGKRIKMHGKYVAPEAGHIVENFNLTLLLPDGTAKLAARATATTYTHTFGIPVTGTFAGYVRSDVFIDGIPSGTVYTTHHVKKVP